MECCFFRVKDAVLLIKVVPSFILPRWKSRSIITITGTAVGRCPLLKLGNGKNGERYKPWTTEIENSGPIFLRALVVMRGSLGDLIMMVEPTWAYFGKRFRKITIYHVQYAACSHGSWVSCILQLCEFYMKNMLWRQTLKTFIYKKITWYKWTEPKYVHAFCSCITRGVSESRSLFNKFEVNFLSVRDWGI